MSTIAPVVVVVAGTIAGAAPPAELTIVSPPSPTVSPARSSVTPLFWTKKVLEILAVIPPAET
jgi:hypothetical protein